MRRRKAVTWKVIVAVGSFVAFLFKRKRKQKCKYVEVQRENRSAEMDCTD